MRRTMVAGVVLAALGGLVPEAKAGFAFDSSVYAEGERLSEKGCANGSWSVPGGKAVPTRDAGRGIAINSSGGVSFTADAEPDGPSATYDFTFSCEGLISAFPEEIPTGERACLYPYEFSDGTTGLCALGDGRWQGLVAEGVSLAPHETIECRVEMREQAGDDCFCRKLYKRYWEIRERYEEVFKDGGLIDTYAPQLAEAGEVDDALWPRSRTAAEDRAILKDYLARRAVWLDKQFASVETLMASLKCDIQSAQSNWDPDATRPASGEVPEIGLEWVREMLEPADVSYAYASAEKLSDAVTSVPTPWGKTTPLWQDYIAGTDPDPKGTNATLRITGFSVVDGAPVIRYSPDLGEKRRYTVLGRESLDDETGWHERREGDRFFKVKVEMP